MAPEGARDAHMVDRAVPRRQDRRSQGLRWAALGSTPTKLKGYEPLMPE